MVQEIIHNVISVHAEVERVSPRNSNQVKDAMLRIVQAVTEEVNRLLVCISRMNSNGCIQVRIHSIFLDHRCSSYHSSNLISVIVILHCKGEMFLVIMSLNSIFDFLSDQK